MAANQPEPFNKLILDELYPDAVQTLTNNAPRLSELCKECLYCLDTNVLLAPFELGEKASANVGKIYESLAKKSRLFVARRAIQEFVNRRTVLLARAYEGLANIKSDMPESVSPSLPFLEAISEYKELGETGKKLTLAKRDFQKALDALRLRLTDWTWDDHISLLYSKVFNNKTVIHHGMTQEDVEKDLAFRQLHSIPPGFADKKKDDGGIGDLLIWHTMIVLGQSHKNHVVFVSNEQKSDWVVKTDKSVVINCRPELSQEFVTKTGQHFGIISFSRFLELNGANEETVQKAGTLEREDSCRQQMWSAVTELRSLIQKNHKADKPWVLDDGLQPLAHLFEKGKKVYLSKNFATFSGGVTRDLSKCLSLLLEANARMQMWEDAEDLSRLNVAADEFIKLSAEWMSWFRTTEGPL